MFKLPKEIKDDIEVYDSELKSFLAGQINPQKFRPLRVVRGIYGQRKETLFMVRVRIVSGRVYLEQLKQLASIAKKYGKGILHITTRQDIQIHHVKLEDTIKVVRQLAEVELSPRGGGGNTIRNIVSCPLSGICSKEVFETSSYVLALSGYLLKNPSNYNLPRKFKIVFDGCSDCCGISKVNDLGFVAIRNGSKDGFKVFCGGGMGLHSKIGFVLEEFISQEELVLVTEAAIRTFNKYGERKNRHKSRLRFLIEKIGQEEFIKRYRQELEELKKEQINSLEPVVDSEEQEESNVVELDLSRDDDFKRWLNANVISQKQKDYYYAGLPLKLGDITSEKLESLVGILERLNKTHIRTSSFQNIIIPYLRKGELAHLYSGLKEIGLTLGRNESITDIVSCMGAVTCNLGICNSRGLASALEERLEKEGFDKVDELIPLNIKVSGCPNSCGQHPIGKISFYGASRRVGNHTAPFYRLLLGANLNIENATFAKECALAAAKDAPNLLCDFLKNYLTAKEKQEDFYAFLQRRGYEDIKILAKKYEKFPTYDENKDYYYDWGKTEEFSLAGIGQGECGAGVLDMIEADLSDGQAAGNKAQEYLKAGQLDLTKKELLKVLIFSSRALLVTFGIDPKNELETFKYFKEKLVADKIVSGRFSDITEKAWELHSQEIGKERLEEFYEYCLSLLNEVKEAYKNMDSHFKFSPKEEKDKAEAKSFTLDLKGVRCPMNYVQAKLYLENIAIGQIVELCLDEGEPIQNVPVSLKNDGQEILEIKKVDGYYKVKVKKLL